MSLTLGSSAGATMGVTVGGYRIVAKFDLASPCDRLDVPACPTAGGVLDGSDTKRFKASVTVLHGSDVVSSTSVEMADRMKLRGQVVDDAKLDTLDITDHAEYSVRTQAVTIRATIKRTALQINMRTGDYKPSRASVDVQVFTHGGVDQSGSAKSDQANSLADDYDKSFSKIVSQEIANYRGLENAWQAPGACAKLAFDPASGALQPLSKGQTGQVTGHVVANSDGGTARSGRWTLVGADNGAITPAGAGGAAPMFTWTVTKAGDDIKLKGHFKATSTAGVASGTWEQETEDRPLYRGTISGTRGDTYIPGECGGGWQFGYSARLADIVGSDQPFPILDTDGSGPAIGGAGGYDETGNGTYTLEPCHGLPACSTSLSLSPGALHGVVLFDADADTVSVTVDVAPIEHGDDCGLPGLTLGEGTFPRSMVGADTITVQLSFNSGPVFGNGTMTLRASTDAPVGRRVRRGRTRWPLPTRPAQQLETKRRRAPRASRGLRSRGTPWSRGPRVLRRHPRDGSKGRTAGQRFVLRTCAISWTAPGARVREAMTRARLAGRSWPRPRTAQVSAVVVIRDRARLPASDDYSCTTTVATTVELLPPNPSRVAGFHRPRPGFVPGRKL